MSILLPDNTVSKKKIEVRMSKVVVFVLGGNVQGFIADERGIEVMIIDYDNETCGEKIRDFDIAPYNPTLVERSLRGVENDDELFAECE
jgi:hypothetical protein